MARKPYMPHSTLSRFLCAMLPLVASAPASADLLAYLRKPDPAFAWRAANARDLGAGTVHALHLVSQQWQGASWQHDLHLYVPKHSERHSTVLLFVTGGGGGVDESAMRLANSVQAPVAVLHDVPNQPLLNGKYEDDLIAESFLRYLATGDPEWPLLLPMTKSVVRAMDALQAFAREKLGREVQGFVVTGASKRGWTSWLAAAGDPRVRGVAPRVIDMLNLPAQMPHQLASWGGYSEMLQPYTDPGLPSFIGTPGGQRLVAMVDPYAYRDRLVVPKLILLGSNDRYWTLDALNLYWDALPGSKHVRYVPNAGHSLGDAGWTDTLACFFQQVAAQAALPELEWKHTRNGARLELAVRSTPAPRSATLWRATSPSRDFREAQWEAFALPAGAAQLQADVALSPREFTAAFVELGYALNGRNCSFSTQVRIEPPSP
jgi:PhoPQ-activated pathogenicity-related protein